MFRVTEVATVDGYTDTTDFASSDLAWAFVRRLAESLNVKLVIDGSSFKFVHYFLGIHEETSVTGTVLPVA